MLGQILQGLTDATQAEAVLAGTASAPIRERIERAAAAANVTVGTLISQRLHRLLNHGDNALWLDLLGAMANTPEPGQVAVDRILAHAFPESVRVRIARTRA